MPKRSAGCDLCRMRKVGCDETKPTCQRCKAFGADCPGYSGLNRVKFMNQTGLIDRKPNSKGKAKPADLGRSYQSNIPFYERGLVSADRPASNELRQQQASSKVTSSQDSSVTQSSSQALAFARSRRVSPFDISTRNVTLDAILAHLLDSFIPPKSCRVGEDNSAYTYIRVLPEMATGNAALRDALETLSLVNVAMEMGDKSLSNASRCSYGKALIQLHKTLSNPRKQTADETLAAIQILAICDFFHSTTQVNNGWFSHVMGSRGLLANRGPKSIKTWLAWRAFLNTRYNLCSSGILRRKAAYFDSPEWLELTAESAKRNYFIAITDAMVKVPALLEDTDKILDNLDVLNVQAVSNLLVRYRELLLEFENWYSIIVAQEGEKIVQSVDMAEFGEFKKSSPTIPFSTAFTFTSVPYAIMISNFYCYKFLLCKNAAEVLDVLQTSDNWQLIAQALPDVPSVRILRHQANTHINSLIRCIPFLCTSPCAIIGRLQVLLFLWFAQDYFGSQNESLLAWNKAGLDFQETHIWCWKMYATFYKMGIVPPRTRYPPRSNTGGRIQIFSIRDMDEYGKPGMRIDKLSDQLGVDVDAMVPPPATSQPENVDLNMDYFTRRSCSATEALPLERKIVLGHEKQA